MLIDSNIFYVSTEKKVYICWQKIDGLSYRIWKKKPYTDEFIILSEGDSNSYKRPRYFDNDHHTELYRPETRNWISFLDDDIQSYQTYEYYIEGYNQTDNQGYESTKTEVYIG